MEFSAINFAESRGYSPQCVYPMLLAPTGKDYLWGGERLKKEYNKRLDMTPLAETWECSTHPDGPSTVVSGPYKGKTLAEVLEAHPEYLGDKRNRDEGFPLLIKFIDADKNLSVQVHPSDEYANKFENGEKGKTEMWYILDAKEGASLVFGFEHSVTPQLLRMAIADGTLSNNLHKVPVHKGDVFLVKAGTVHAIGEGVLIAEIQESSNLTYRLYDYGRKDKYGKLRELHFDKAIEVLDMSPIGEIRQHHRLIKYFYGCSREVLCRCKYFEVEKIKVRKGFSFSVLQQSFHVLLCIDGEGGLETDTTNRPVRFIKGSCVFIPAGVGRCHVIGECDLLKIRC